MELTDKITNVEQLNDLVRQECWSKSNSELAPYKNSQLATPPNMQDAASRLNWWTVREQLRIDKGVYATTPELDWINSHFGVFAHVSQEDKNLVCYTPDNQFGAQDRQLRLTPGRLFSKLLPLYRDDMIRDLVANHLAEVATEIVFLSGQDLVSVYREGGGSSSCMAKPFDNMAHHPCEAYDAPNIQMAVVRRGDGKITGRAMVYEPSEDDKRVIQYYGDTRLRAALQKRGYQLSGWSGAQFKAVKYEDDDAEPGDWPPRPPEYTRFAMPYLDCEGGTANSSRGSAVAYYRGTLLSVDTRRQQALGRKGYYAGKHWATAGARGYVDLVPVDDNAFTLVDELYGDTIDTLTAETIPQTRKVYKDGAVRSTFRSVPEVFGDGYEYANFKGNSYPCDQADTVRVGRDRFVNTEENLAYYEIRKVGLPFCEEEVLQEERKLVKSPVSLDKFNELVGASGDFWSNPENWAYAQATDVFDVVVDDVAYSLHKSLLEPKKFVKLHSGPKDREVYVRKGDRFMLTRKNRKFLPSYHSNIVEFWDRTWDFTRNVKHQVELFGEVLRAGTEMTQYELKDHRDKLVAEQGRKSFNAAMLTNSDVFAAVQGISSRNSTAYLYHGVQLFTEWTQGKAFAERTSQFSELLRSISRHGNVHKLASMLRWLHTQWPGEGGNYYQGISEALNLWIAEAEAIDYNETKEIQNVQDSAETQENTATDAVFGTTSDEAFALAA